MHAPSFTSRHAARGFTLLEVCFTVAITVAVGSLQISSLRSQAVQKENLQAASGMAQVIAGAKQLYMSSPRFVGPVPQSVIADARLAPDFAMKNRQFYAPWDFERSVQLERREQAWSVSYSQVPVLNCSGFAVEGFIAGADAVVVNGLELNDPTKAVEACDVKDSTDLVFLFSEAAASPRTRNEDLTPNARSLTDPINKRFSTADAM